MLPASELDPSTPRRRPIGGCQNMSTEETEHPESTMQRRYAPPEAVAGLETYPKPVGFIGFVLSSRSRSPLLRRPSSFFPSVAQRHRARLCLAESLVHTRGAGTVVAVGLGPALGC